MHARDRGLPPERLKHSHTSLKENSATGKRAGGLNGLRERRARSQRGDRAHGSRSGRRVAVSSVAETAGGQCPTPSPGGTSCSSRGGRDLGACISASAQVKHSARQGLRCHPWGLFKARDSIRPGKTWTPTITSTFFTAAAPRLLGSRVSVPHTEPEPVPARTIQTSTQSHGDKSPEHVTSKDGELRTANLRAAL